MRDTAGSSGWKMPSATDGPMQEITNRIRKEEGYAILVVVFLAAMVAFALAAAAPSVLTKRQREREKELLFRGEQYKRAIGLYHRKFNRLPMKVKDLLHTNGLSFLRRPWPDPMTKEGEWRLLRLGPGGQIVGSLATASAQARGPLGSRASTPGSSSDIETLPLIGVASKSTQQSFYVYNDQESYQLWEFVYNPRQAAGQQPQGAGGQGRQDGQGNRNKPNGGRQSPQRPRQ